MKLQPVGNKVLVKRLAAPTHSPGGITLPDQAKDMPRRGNVLAIGQGVNLEKYPMKVGDEVVFDSYVGTKVELAGIDYLLLEDKEVLAKVVE